MTFAVERQRGTNKCTQAVPDPPITVTSQQYGATHTYSTCSPTLKGVPDTVY